MAISPSHLSFSTIQLLFGQRPTTSAGRIVAEHQHPHWQFEWLLSGEALAICADTQHRLLPQSGLLIPPGLVHGFRYDHPGTSWVSIKFVAETNDYDENEYLLPEHPAAAALATAISACVEVDGHVEAAAAPALASLLALRQRPLRPAHDDMIGRIRRRIAEAPLLAWRVEDLARDLGLSAGHCSARFRSETGAALKMWLDQQRADACKQLLRYADADITTIAEQADFVDVFTFSRFIKRVTGKAPSAWREPRQ
jgi:AraC-like DNA-binding protein